MTCLISNLINVVSDEVKKHIVRLLSFVPSTVLCTVPLTAALTRDMGRYTAQTQIDLVVSHFVGVFLSLPPSLLKGLGM